MKFYRFYETNKGANVMGLFDVFQKRNEVAIELKNKLLENHWFEYCGTSENCNYFFSYVRIDNAKKAVKGVASIDWENLCLEERGNFTSYLSKEHKKEYREHWNKTVLELKETFIPLLAERIIPALPEKGLSEKVWDDVRFNLITILMIDFYSYDVSVDFFDHLLEIYLSGHLPCGMENGKLIIY